MNARGLNYDCLLLLEKVLYINGRSDGSPCLELTTVRFRFLMLDTGFILHLQ